MEQRNDEAEQIAGIFTKMNKYADQAAFTEKACALLWGLSGDPETIDLILPHIDTIVTALQNHVNHSKICRNACGALWNLATDFEAKIRLRPHIPVIIAAMKTHAIDPNVCKGACGTLFNLCHHNDRNKVLLGSHISTLVSVMQMFNKAHAQTPEKGASVCIQVCGLLWMLAKIAVNKVLMGSHIPAIIDCMQTHIICGTVTGVLCCTLEKLAVLNDENQAALRSHTSAIVAVMETHPDDMEAQKWSRRLLHTINKSDEVVKHMFNLNKKRFLNN